MNQDMKIIIKKLDNIEKRLTALEKYPLSPPPPPPQTTPLKTQKDPLFSAAVAIIEKYEEISALQLAKELKIDTKKAEEIMDQLEKAGLGMCYTKEI